MLDPNALITGQNRADRDTLNVGKLGLEHASSMTEEETVIYWQVMRYFDIGQQSIEIFRLVANSPPTIRRVPSAVLRSLLNSSARDDAAEERHVERTRDELDRILAHSLVEIRVELLYGERAMRRFQFRMSARNESDLCPALVLEMRLLRVRGHCDGSVQDCNSCLCRR